MYVIYPAEEIISLTYGVAATVQRPTIQRPTLDNLREPLVPVGTRTPSPASVPSSSTSKSQPKSANTNHRQSSTYAQNNNPNVFITDQTPFETSDFDETITLNNFNGKPIAYYTPPSSPSLDPATSAITSQGRVGTTADKPPQPPPKQGKPKSKLQLKFAKLGRPHSSPEPAESTRVLEYHDIRVSNPTFTRDNLRARNFDAFFEAGESVYSIEKKEKTSSPSTEPSPTIDDTFYVTPQQPPPKPPKSKLNFLKRNKTPQTSKQQQQQPSSSRRGSRSSDIFLIVEEPQKEPTKSRRLSLFGSRVQQDSRKRMATSSGGGILRDLGHPGLNDTLKVHNSVTFKLVKTVSDFSETLAQVYEQHANALQLLVQSYRKKNGELRKERPACQSSLFYAWEIFLQEIEADSAASSDVANALSRQVSRPLLERSFHRKIQSRKVFTHRESFDTIIAKTEEKLSKCRIDYKQFFAAHRQNPTQHSLQQYIDAHNAYVQQLHATNAMLEAYHCDTVPQLLQELEEIYDDLCNIMSEAVLQGAESISAKATDMAKRYDGLVGHCKAINGFQDLTNFARSIQLPPNAQRVPKKAFAPPQPIAANATGENDEINEYGDSNVPIFKNELVIERGGTLVLRPSLDQMKREATELETQIRQLQDSVDVLVRTQMRGLEGQLYNKANELQEDISMKKFDLRAKEIHLAAVLAQKELFIKKTEPGSPIGAPGERKLSTSSSSSMKTKWMKAFRSLKPASSSSGAPEKKNGAAAGNSQMSRMGDVTTDNHNLQEYTYKKITPCDVCSQVLRGHQRQGLRCRMCKTNVHVECVTQLGKCSVKAKLLRRQKSTSEIDNRGDVDEETEGPLLISRKLSSRGVYNNIETTEQTVDQTYQVLKQAGEISSSKAIDTMKTTTTANINDVSGVGGAGGNNGATTAMMPPMMNLTMKDIPVVNVPDYPDRVVVAPRRQPLKPSSINQGPNLQPIKQGLTAPPQDVSSSDYRIPVPVQAPFFTNPSTTATIPLATGSQPPLVPQLVDPGIRRRLFAGFRPLSGFGRLRMKSSQHRSISLPETPHSPRRQKLNLRMKSLSLDSPESTELHGQMRRRYPAGPGPSAYYGGSGGGIDHSTPPSNNSKNNSRLHSPSSPSQPQRKLLYASRGLKSGSVDLPDEVDKSLSSASTSPCPSPVRQSGKSHRLLPTNLYVVLYNFKARHQDELDLKAGYKVTVIDTSDPDWWKGKCLGRIGYFPSKYVLKLAAGEKVLQVTHNIQIVDTERGDSIALLRDQIVIQTGDEINGMTKIRSADKRQGVCPSKYLQEV